MNLHSIAGPIVGIVNPPVLARLFVNIGSVTAADGTRVPNYAIPALFTGAIAAGVLTVSNVTAGKVEPGQQIFGAGVLPGTVVTAVIQAADGTYSVVPTQDVPSTDMSGDLVLRAQMQSLTWRDLQQLEGLNLAGVRRKVYLSGAVDSVVRVNQKGGDLLLVRGGVNDGLWLVAQVLEQWQGWCCAAVTLQNETPGAFGQLDFSDPNQSGNIPLILTGV
jgi:hypothetical protein